MTETTQDKITALWVKLKERPPAQGDFIQFIFLGGEWMQVQYYVSPPEKVEFERIKE